jgi:hypothetical protein
MDKREELRKLADTVAKDLKGDFPYLTVDYDIYMGKIDGMYRGVIDMGGDLYQRSFVWSFVQREWKEDTALPTNVPALIEQIQNAGLE